MTEGDNTRTTQIQGGTCPACGNRYQSHVTVQEKGRTEVNIEDMYRTDDVCLDWDDNYVELFIHGEKR